MQEMPILHGQAVKGPCECGCPWENHHLSAVMNQDYFEKTGESYIAEECETFGFNETGGLDAEGRNHCQKYKEKI